jgi:hypothetical protein
VKIAQEEDEDIILHTNDDTPELVKIRHSTAHIMAMAVQRLFRERKLPCQTIDALSLLSRMHTSKLTGIQGTLRVSFFS